MLSTHQKTLKYLDSITYAIVKRSKMDEGFIFAKSDLKLKETRA